MKAQVELKKTERALGIAVDALRHLSANMTASEALAEVKSILAPPPPEMEEVNIEQYTVITPNGGCLGTYPTPEAAAGVMHESYQLVPLRGTYQRPVPQPVERSVSVEVKVNGEGAAYTSEGPGYEQRWYPFRFRPEVHNTTGTLTFTWTEELKP